MLVLGGVAKVPLADTATDTSTLDNSVLCLRLVIDFLVDLVPAAMTEAGRAVAPTILDGVVLVGTILPNKSQRC